MYSKIQNRKILLASPRGFCAGVHRAVEIVDICLELYGTPLYVHHQIVHNRHVVEGLTSRGVVFVESIEDIPDNFPVVFSAHGVSPHVRNRAQQKNLKIIDATCPLVTKVHLEAVRYSRLGYRILLIGHKNHVETRGTFGEAPEQISIIEKPEDIENLNFDQNTKMVYLTQTTLSVDDTREMLTELKKKYPNIVQPASSDICYATTNRQKAVMEIAQEVDLVLVVGSKNSSNSNRLKEVAQKLGKPAYLIDSSDNIKKEWISDSVLQIGITAGASAPEKVVSDVIKKLETEFFCTQTEEIIVKQENMVFQLPPELTAVKN